MIPSHFSSFSATKSHTLTEQEGHDKIFVQKQNTSDIIGHYFQTLLNIFCPNHRPLGFLEQKFLFTKASKGLLEEEQNWEMHYRSETIYISNK